VNVFCLVQKQNAGNVIFVYKMREIAKKLGRVLFGSGGCYLARPSVIRLGRVLFNSAGCYFARPGVILLGRDYPSANYADKF